MMMMIPKKIIYIIHFLSRITLQQDINNNLNSPLKFKTECSNNFFRTFNHIMIASELESNKQ